MTDSKLPAPMQDEQTARFRAILAGDEEDKPSPVPAASVMDRLPRAVKPASSSSLPPPQSSAKRVSNKSSHAEAGLSRKSRRERIASAYWTVTGTMSLIVDAILVAVIIILLWQVRKLNVQLDMLQGLPTMPLETVKGLYDNFEKMNISHIVTTIPYTTEIPVQFEIQISEQTEVVLSRDTPINGARVTLTTGGLEISNAPANIILPAGTPLPITLTLTVPVDKRVTVNLDVPVDIDLAKTDLGVPFTGLMDVLEPLYCLLDPAAVDSLGVSICEKAKSP